MGCTTQSDRGRSGITVGHGGGGLELADYVIRANEQEMRTVYDLAVRLREYKPILPVQSVHYADVLDTWMARYEGPGLWDSEDEDV